MSTILRQPPALSGSAPAQILKPATSPPAAVRQIVLAGNPNVGKSLFFNALTGQYVNVSNFPGTTVDIPRGVLKPMMPCAPATTAALQDAQLKDSPGVYGLSMLTDEERVATQEIMAADVIINVVSAVSLNRDLFLTQQLLDYGKRVVVALNQMDEANARQVAVDGDRLSALLGVPVIPTVAVTQDGLAEVLDALPAAATGLAMPGCPTPEQLQDLEGNLGSRMIVYGQRRAHVNAIVAQVVRTRTADESAASGLTLSQRLGNWLLHPLGGLLSLAVVLLALYQIVGVWIAGDLVNFVEGTLMLGRNADGTAASFVGVIPLIQHAVGWVVPQQHWLFQVLAGEFGVLTMSVQYIFGVLFPLVLGFYLYIAVLEDCGYLPRIAVLSDGLLNRIGLNGRAVIPLILGFGCVTMATVATRVLTSERERTIASTILAITIPCSAQLAVIMALMATVGLKGWLAYVGTLFAVLVTLGTVLNKVLPGRSSSLILDLPPMRLPMAGNVFKKSWIRTKMFLLEAAPLFLAGSLLVAILQVSGGLMWIQTQLTPVTEALLHLPGKTAQVFIMGMVRRDFGAAGLFFMKDTLTSVQIITTLMVITLFVPCLASAAVIWKERGMKEGVVVLAGSWLIAFGVGAMLARILALPGVF
ncbi:MAG: ferrous iron transport protein B [Candidatus Melainabacteria bacterium]